VVLPVGLATATTEDVEDVNGRPPGGVPTGPAAATTKDEEDTYGGSPRGAASGSASGHHRR
jgi:hypothetical protein